MDEITVIFETYDWRVLQVRVTGSRDEVTSAAKRFAQLDPDHFCVRWGDSNTCACAHFLR